MSDRARTVVVGFDGSPTSRAALAWGAERAGDGGSLFVVYAFDLPPDMLGGTTYQHAVADHKEHGRSVLAVLPDFPGLTVETELIGGHAGEAIADGRGDPQAPTRSSSARAASARCAARSAAPRTSCCTGPSARSS